MKALLVVSVLVGLSSATKGQLTYEKFYTTGVSYKFNCTELTSKNLFVGLGCAHGISRVDQEGNVIQTRCYVPNPMARITSCRRKADDRFMFATSYQLDTCGASGSFTVPYTHPAIGIMDTTGNILAYKHYVLGEGCRNAAGDLVVTADNGAVVWGSDTSFFILKVDSNLAPVWSRRFGDPGGIQFVKELPGGDLLVGANMGSIGAVVARLDADGNVLWSKSYIRPTSMVHDAVIEADDSFIVTGVTESTTSLFTVPLAPEYHPKLFMMKLDGAGAVQWCRGYENAPERWYAAQPSRIERTLDGNYVMLATSGVHDNGLNYNHFSRLHLMKTDVNGDTIWTSAVGASDFNFYAMDLLVYSDGGYMMSGYAWGELPNLNSSCAFIFKSDPGGSLSCMQEVHHVQVVDLFPSDSTVTLSSTDGVVEQPAMMGDTIFTFSTYDACSVTALPVRHKAPRFSVHPNPNTGRFTVQFADPLMAESYYSVYDAMGKLLLQRRLPPGATVEEVDLSHFGSGTYIIKFTSPDGVCHERVVVE